MKVRGNDAFNRINERVEKRAQREFASVGDRSLEVQRKAAQEPDPEADVISTEDVEPSVEEEEQPEPIEHDDGSPEMVSEALHAVGALGMCKD